MVRIESGELNQGVNENLEKDNSGDRGKGNNSLKAKQVKNISIFIKFSRKHDIEKI